MGHQPISTHQNDPPPPDPTAQHRPIRKVTNRNTKHTEHTIATDSTTFDLPHDWWEQVLDQERSYDTGFTDTYRHHQDICETLYTEGHTDAAQTLLQHNYWSAVEYYLNDIETNQIPSQLMQAVEDETTH